MKDFNLIKRTLMLLSLLGAFSFVKAQTGLVQVINNSPDTSIKSIDIRIDTAKVGAGINFQMATGMITVNVGVHKLLISTKDSTDTLSYTASWNIDSGKVYLVMVNGVKDTTKYAANPGGINRKLNLNVSNNYKTSGSTGTAFDFVLYNGVQDAAAININEASPTASNLFNNISYNLSLQSGSSSTDYIFNISNADNTKFWASYRLSASQWLGKVGVLFTSGFSVTSGNPVGAGGVRVFLALTNGTVIELPKLFSQVQLIHNCADTTSTKLDFYVNGALAVNDLSFRTSTAQMNINAYVPMRMHIALGTSTDTSSALYAFSNVFDTSYNIFIAKGLIGTGYAANPDGRNTGFGLAMTKGKQLPYYSNNNELLFYHGCTDLSYVTIRGELEPTFMAKNIAYGDFYRYTPARSNSAGIYDVSDTLGNLKGMYAMNFVGKINKTGILFASGLQTMDMKNIIEKDTIKGSQGQDSIISIPKSIVDTLSPRYAKRFGYYIAWNDGKIDTLFKQKLLGVQQLTADHFGINMYPNPARDEVMINYELSRTEQVQVNIFDMKGMNVMNIANEKQQAGPRSLKVNISALSKGIYIMQVKLEDKQAYKKLIVE